MFQSVIRILLSLLFAVLLPLGQARCSSRMARAAQVTEHAGHHGHHECCAKSVPSPARPTDSCCCDRFEIPAATAAASITIEPATSVPMAFAVAPVVAIALVDRNVCARFAPDARSGSPPDPSLSPESPRSPPPSA